MLAFCGAALAAGGLALRDATLEMLARRQAVWDVACAPELALPVGVSAENRLVALAITIRAHGAEHRVAICGASPWSMTP